ncbi:hypothetical protein BX661DRAFT_175843 [Kickxella alabastrina]|uniref:uncharacterized protein n=1 Tax=Kickxella alabastrina TaxID=61397 RepID=UPI002220D79C|nr:uncharacterized protein BX661DRAFT_175843 [Kickxella alabastrina]KAI7834959.1 hypothetical protein BX661DRAFT_175843 [Kickxella alabastrina]
MDTSDFETPEPVLKRKPPVKIGPCSKVSRTNAYAPDDEIGFVANGKGSKASENVSPRTSANTTRISSDESTVLEVDGSDDDEDEITWGTEKLKAALLKVPRFSSVVALPAMSSRRRVSAVSASKAQMVKPAARPKMTRYTIQAGEQEEDDTLEVMNESTFNDGEGSANDLPCRSLDNFVIFNKMDNNALIEISELYEDNIDLSISGNVVPLEMGEVDIYCNYNYGDEDGEDDDEEVDSNANGNVSRQRGKTAAPSNGANTNRAGRANGSSGFTQRIYLSAIVSYEAYLTSSGETEVWARTTFGWYKLLSPHPDYAHAYAPFYKSIYMAHQALFLAKTEPRLSLSNFIVRMRQSPCDIIACLSPITEGEFRKYRDDIILEINACAEASDMENLLDTQLIRTICREPIKNESSKREFRTTTTTVTPISRPAPAPRNRNPRAPVNISSKTATKENPACVTTLVASIAKGLYAQHLVNVSHFATGPASRATAAASSSGADPDSETNTADDEGGAATKGPKSKFDWQKKHASKKKINKAQAEKDLGKVSVPDLRNGGIDLCYFKGSKVEGYYDSRLPRIDDDKRHYSEVLVTPKPDANNATGETEPVSIKVGDTVLVSVMRPTADHALETIWESEATDDNLDALQNSTTVSGPFVRVFQITMIMYSTGSRCWMFHGRMLLPGRDTILQEVALPNEWFLVDQCHTLSLLASLCGKINIPFIPTKQELDTFDMVSEKKMFCRFWYDTASAMFEDVNLHAQAIGKSIPMWCPSCRYKQTSEEIKIGRAIVGSKMVPRLSQSQGSLQSVNCPEYVQTATVNGIEYHVNDVVYYPSQHQDQPFEIGYINKFFDKLAFINKVKGTTRTLSAEIQILKRMVVLPVEKRPAGQCEYNDGRELYWTPQAKDIDVSTFRGKCWVVHPEEVDGSLNLYKDNDVNAFYARYESTKLWPDKQAHWVELKPFSEAPEADSDADGEEEDERMPAAPCCRICRRQREWRTRLMATFIHGATKPVSAHSRADAPRASFMRGRHPLRALDLFSGCGGLTQGMDQSGIVKTMWSVEFMESAGVTFAKNHPKAQVYNQCSNLLLDSAIKAHQGIPVEPLINKFDGRQLPPMPQPGDVDFIYCGPPCQGFSRCNRFLKADDIKTSLIANALSYVDFYRPSYFLLENVRGLLNYRLGGVQIGKGRIGGGIEMGVLKFILRTLTNMGYQTRFFVLQAGNYNLAQSRRRLFVWGCKRGCRLPEVPRPISTFAKSNQTNINFPNGTVYAPFAHLNGNAPHHAVTVGDAIGDLPKFEFINPAIHYPDPEPVRNSEWPQYHTVYGSAPGLDPKLANLSFVGLMEMQYSQAPMSEFQRLRRRREQICIPGVKGDYDELVDTLYNHVCRKFKADNVERICRVTMEPGMDHSSLPLTLRPWCLSSEESAASRNNGWKGLFGRIDPKQYFGTALTEMEPMGKSGTVLLHDQRRLFTVRECARAQGFPDTFRLYNFNEKCVKDMYRQVGNAVPPPLAYALSLELRDALFRDFIDNAPDETLYPVDDEAGRNCEDDILGDIYVDLSRKSSKRENMEMDE